MRRTLLVAASTVIIGFPVQAQGFEGVIRFIVPQERHEPVDTLIQLSSGSRLRWGTLIDDDTVRYTLIPDRKQYLQYPGDTRGYDDLIVMRPNGVVTKANITDTIAGISCEIWHYAGTSADGRPDVSDVCIAKNAGLMLNRQGGHTQLYFAASGSQFRDVLRLDTGILKATQNGKTTFLVVSAEPMSLPDSMFVPPRQFKRWKIRHQP